MHFSSSLSLSLSRLSHLQRQSQKQNPKGFKSSKIRPLICLGDKVCCCYHVYALFTSKLVVVAVDGAAICFIYADEFSLLREICNFVFKLTFSN